jgi:Rrf2 family protein
MLSRTAEYALRAVVCLAQERDRTESADRLAEMTKIPRRYLHKVLQNLVQGNLVRSQSGPGGGYSLVPSPKEISILDVVNAVVPLERIHACPLGLKSHTDLCPLHLELDKACAATEHAFSRVTIAHLLRSTNKIVPLREIT